MYWKNPTDNPLHNVLPKTEMRISMRKICVVVACILWIVAGINVLGRQQERKEVNVVNAFGRNNFYEINTRIEGCAKIDEALVGSDAQQKLLVKLANRLKLKNYKIAGKKENQRVTLELLQEGDNAKVEIRMVTIEESRIKEQHIVLNLDLKHNSEYALYYKELVSDMFEELGLSGDVTLIMEGKIDGRLDKTGRNIIADTYMEKIDADIVSQNRDEELFVIYGYTSGIREYMKVNNAKINVSFSIDYNEEEDCTNVNLVTPVL